MSLRLSLFRFVFAGLAATNMHRLAGPGIRGLGAILMLHQVRPWRPRGFAPNRLLEVEPGFLDAALARARARGYSLVPLDAVPDLLAKADPSRPFLAITFDDGYRDTLEQALPILRRHGAPATVFVTPGFADRTATLWWTDLEDTIAASRELVVETGDSQETLSWADDAGRQTAFERVYWDLRRGPEERLRSVIDGLARRAGVDPLATVEQLCLDWEGIRALAADPLVTIGAHTLTHPMLAKHDAAFARHEVEQSRAIIEKEIGKTVRHLAYPVGDRTSAGAREFAVAAELGFETAVTTRPGMLFPEHADHLTALPRLSLNGNFQDPGQFEILLSGLPFLLWNRGRRLNVA